MFRVNLVILYVVLAFLTVSCSKQITKIACIGDSITEGSGIRYQSKSSYPVILDSILGMNYSVLNSGKSGTTLQKNGDFPYWNTKEFSNVKAFNPDIIIIKLGTNDSKGQNWKIGHFEADYQSLIDTLKVLHSNPKIFVCLPVPPFETVWAGVAVAEGEVGDQHSHLEGVTGGGVIVVQPHDLHRATTVENRPARGLTLDGDGVIHDQGLGDVVDPITDRDGVIEGGGVQHRADRSVIGAHRIGGCTAGAGVEVRCARLRDVPVLAGSRGVRR